MVTLDFTFPNMLMILVEVGQNLVQKGSNAPDHAL